MSKIKNNNSKQGRIVRHILMGKSITQKMAIEMFNHYRLAVVIDRMRKAGYNVVTKMVSRGDVTFAMYYLKRESNV